MDLTVGRGKQLVLKLALLLIPAMVILGLGELGLRVLRPLDHGSSHEHRIPHPVRGWSLEPGASYVNQVGAMRVPVQYTRSGWRDIEHNLPKPDDEQRIVILGDSFMEGYSVALHQLLSRLLEDRLHAREVPVRVVNLGVGGYGTLQELLAFREAGTQHEPTLVLLGFYENDLQNNLREFEALKGEDALKVRSRPFLSEEKGFAISDVDYAGAVERFEAQRLIEREALWPRIRRHSALVQQVERSLIRLGKYRTRVRRMLDASSTRATGAMSQDAEDAHQVARTSELALCKGLIDRSWVVTERLLAQLRREVHAAGARLMVFSVPSINALQYETVATSPSRTTGRCAIDGTRANQLEQITTRLEIGLVDLFPAFHEAAAGDPGELFHRADSHWNAAGHALAAEVIANSLYED